MNFIYCCLLSTHPLCTLHMSQLYAATAALCCGYLLANEMVPQGIILGTLAFMLNPHRKRCSASGQLTGDKYYVQGAAAAGAALETALLDTDPVEQDPLAEGETAVHWQSTQGPQVQPSLYPDTTDLTLLSKSLFERQMTALPNEGVAPSIYAPIDGSAGPDQRTMDDAKDKSAFLHTLLSGDALQAPRNDGMDWVQAELQQPLWL